MTPARKAALQFFHDRGKVSVFTMSESPLTATMLVRLLNAGQLEGVGGFYTLTDAGRRALNGDPA